MNEKETMQAGVGV